MKVPNDGYGAACDIIFQAGSYTTALKLYNSVKTVWLFTSNTKWAEKHLFFHNILGNVVYNHNV